MEVVHGDWFWMYQGYTKPRGDGAGLDTFVPSVLRLHQEPGTYDYKQTKKEPGTDVAQDVAKNGVR